MIVNAIQCPRCGDTIYSRTRHDYRSCSCGSVSIDGGFDYMISSNSDTSGHYKIDNIKLNLVNEFIRYEVLVTSNYSRLWKGAVDIYEGENNLNIEV